MNNIKSFISALVVMIILTGCVQPVKPPIPLYKWGNYVESSSEYGMNGEKKEVIEKHLLELEKIINSSENDKQRVAPGIYAEYAQILFETNKKEKAKKYFNLEKDTYPESITFINQVLLKLYGDKK